MPFLVSRMCLEDGLADIATVVAAVGWKSLYALVSSCSHSMADNTSRTGGTLLYDAPQFQAEKKFPFGGPGGMSDVGHIPVSVPAASSCMPSQLRR